MDDNAPVFRFEIHNKEAAMAIAFNDVILDIKAGCDDKNDNCPPVFWGTPEPPATPDVEDVGNLAVVIPGDE